MCVCVCVCVCVGGGRGRGEGEDTLSARPYVRPDVILGFCLLSCEIIYQKAVTTLRRYLISTAY